MRYAMNILIICNTFITNNYLKTTNVEQFYSNPAFSTIHDLSFTSGSAQKLNNFKQGLNKKLFDLKNNLIFTIKYNLLLDI